MEKKKILFIGTPFMNIYQDILAEMVNQGYEVDFIAEKTHLDDPDNVRGWAASRPQLLKPEDFAVRNKAYWIELLADPRYNKVYDILFVLDGQSVAPCVFEILRNRNANLYSVNYLFDTTKGVYRFDKNFKFFNKVATFDREESEKYAVTHLPIYWKPFEDNVKNEYVFFGLGRYNKERAALFKRLINVSENNGYKSYLKLQGEHLSYFPLKYIIRRLTGTGAEKPSWEDYYSDWYIQDQVPLDEFRRLIAASEIIVDTNAPHQDGLTARFMWAVGLGKKILTTNSAAKLYDFYSAKQIYVIDEIDSFTTLPSFSVFLKSSFSLSDDMLPIVNQYRIDNWLKGLLLNW